MKRGGEAGSARREGRQAAAASAAVQARAQEAEARAFPPPARAISRRARVVMVPRSRCAKTYASARGAPFCRLRVILRRFCPRAAM